MRTLLTGMSGAGKSTVLRALAARGYRTVDTDEDGWSELVAAPAGEVTGPGRGLDWVWRADRIAALLSTQDTLFVGGCSPNQGRFYPRFDRIILLTAPPAVLDRRLAERTTNPFGKQPGEAAGARQLRQTVEPLLRRAADLVLDTSAPLAEVVDAVLRHTGQRVPNR